MGQIWLLAIFLISFEIRKIRVCHREGGDMYNGDADAEDPVDGSKKRKKKVTKCLTLAHSQYVLDIIIPLSEILEKSFKIQFHNLKVGVVKKKAEVSVKLKGDPKGTKVIPENCVQGDIFNSAGFEDAVPCPRRHLLHRLVACRTLFQWEAVS